MKSLLTVIILFTAITTWGQSDILMNINLSVLDTIECMNQSTTIAKYWDVYQTENDQWDGEKDTTTCYEVSAGDYSGLIVSNDFDPAKKLFLRYVPDTLPTLEPNTIYGALAGAFPFRIGQYAEDCEDDNCTGILLQLEVPDSTGIETKTQDLFYSLVDNFGEFCFATDRLTPVRLKEFILQLQWDGAWSDTVSLWAEFRKADYQGIVDNTIIPESMYTGNYYEIEHADLNSEYNTTLLLLNRDSIHYPSSANIYYEDLQLAENKPSAQEIRINVWGSLLFQSFAQLRGGLVQESDSIRHKISYYLSDVGNFCLYNPAEIILEDGGNLILDNGAIHFYAKDACVQISRGSKLIIAENSNTLLGNNGKGILAMRNGGEILVKENASLTLDLKLEMHELKGEKKSQNIKTHLSSGAHLSFTKNAVVSNDFSLGQQMKMVVYLNGGSVDLSQLSARERELIIIAESEEIASQNTWFVYPNPASDLVNIFNSRGANAQELFILNEVGQRLIWKRNDSEINVSSLPAGLYYLAIISENKPAVFKFIKR